MLMVMFTLSVHAQTRRADKNAIKAADIKLLVESKKYLFVANQAFPMGGSMINLTSANFDLKLANDTLTTFLPYYGVVYSAPINAADGGVKLTTTKFAYKAVLKKNGSYEIDIKPTNPEVRGPGDVNRMILNVSPDGYATLQVFSVNRQGILFNGWLEKIKPEKAS